MTTIRAREPMEVSFEIIPFQEKGWPGSEDNLIGGFMSHLNEHYDKTEEIGNNSSSRPGVRL